jgi:hypothetical protein
VREPDLQLAQQQQELVVQLVRRQQELVVQLAQQQRAQELKGLARQVLMAQELKDVALL